MSQRAPHYEGMEQHSLPSITVLRGITLDYTGISAGKRPKYGT